VSGLRYFIARIDEEEEFGEGHHREDFDVFEAHLSKDEAGFARLELAIHNPREPLIGAGRKEWLYFAEDTGDGVHLWFKGRIVVVPDSMNREVIRVVYMARPSDYRDRFHALAESLRTHPTYDHLWVPENLRDDDDYVWEARHSIWDTDPVSHDVTDTDLLTGEDGTLVFDSSDIIADPDVEITVGEAPLAGIRMRGTVSWQQEATGTIDVSNAVRNAFPDGLVASYTGQGFQADFERSGRRIGAGWTLRDARLDRTDGVQVAAVSTQGITQTATVVDYRKWTFWPTVILEYDASRTFVETIEFVVRPAMQPSHTPPDAGRIEEVYLSSRDASEPIDPGDAMPIGDPRRRQFFVTNRGRAALDYLICHARAKALGMAAPVRVTVTVPWERGRDLSCRKNALIIDDRINSSDGQAAGKITGYRCSVIGDTGERIAEFTIRCATGTGDTVEASPGTPTWVEEGVLEPGIQVYEGQVHMPVAGEITHPDYSDHQPNDDGIDFFDMRPSQIFNEIEVTGTAAEHEAIIAASHGTMHLAFDALNEAHTQVCLDLKPLNGGPFESDIDLGDLPLMVPAGIDLGGLDTIS
jgi:hypothetical protein